MSNEFETDEDAVFTVVTPRKMRKWDLIAVTIHTASATLGAVSDGLMDMAGVLLRQSEYEQMRHNFHEDAAYELETLISEVENGTAN